MNNRIAKSSLLLGAAFAGLAAASPAMAQAADDSATGDIIVTAQRVEQRLQDVPISITVFNQQQLTQRNIAVATDLATYTPSLAVNQRYGPEKASFSIRGFNQDQSTAPTVGVYFAEVVGVRAQGGTTSGNTVGAGSFTDLANVQVLKGPQGTLFGRNTTGGAVLLTPKKPTGDLEGFIEGTYGNYDQKRVQAALNLPLAETFKVRLSAERNHRDGYMKNRSGVGPSAYNDVDYFYGRLSIVADLTPDLENYTIASYSNSFSHGFATRITGCASGAGLNSVPGSTDFSGTRLLQATSCAEQLARQNLRGDSLYDVESGVPGAFLSIKQWQVINTTTWRASDSLTVKNIMSYGEFKERANFDLSTSNFRVANVNGTGGFNPSWINPRIPSFIVPAGTPYQRIVLDNAGPTTGLSSQLTFTEELQLQGSAAGGKLTYVLGGYFEMSRPNGDSTGRTAIFLNCTSPQNLACSNPLAFGSISESSTRINFNNNGVFGQSTYNFTDKLALTAGIRYTWDKIAGSTNSTRASLARAGTPGAFNDPISGVLITRACTDSFRHLTDTPGLDRSVCTTRLVNKSTAPTWLIDLDYKPTPDLLFYAKYARGYRQGGMNFTNPGLETWKPEKMDTYEVGAKASFRGAVSGYFNLAGFYNKLTDQQVFAQLIPTPAAAATGVAGGAAIINAGKARIYGLEADASVTMFEYLRLDGGYTYLNTRINALASTTELAALVVGTPFLTPIPTVSVGSSFTNAPKHKLTMTGTLTVPMDESLGKLSLGATWVHTSRYVNDGASPAFVNGIGLGVTPSTNLINLNVDWKGIGGSPLDASFFVTNLTKETFNVANSAGWNSAGVAEILLNQPRFYGVRLRYSFGQ